ncbi:glucuronide permease [Virgibacillus profundi]|uniref:Glucuronide permease n=1 Tax=Virgibacillus profundi TaxID=2024555 RepID=A0A2A2IHJ6_9BACI|nr:MFS transporter [Virgibacillus profundi]PAV30620.1 glucuronide permease [Virgibacillus profundi]PXY54792.1 MFS transporter [Virgibacillus profundi]
MSSAAVESGQKYNKAKLWQIGFFALNNTATNIYMFILTFVSYYAAGVAGLTVAVVSIVLTAMRVFDGITDPIVGFIIDKTESKFGKFRPLMILGNVLLATSVILMYAITHTLPLSLQLIFFVLTYGLYVIGYTFQTAVTKAAQTVLTNDPKQRPLFSVFDGVYNTGVFTVGQVYVASYLIGKHGDFNIGLFSELNTLAIILAGIFTVLAVIGISGKDKKEFYGLADLTVNTKFRDYWKILKGNKPLKFLITAVTADKLAFSLLRQSVVMVMIFGILMGDYELSGTVSMITVVPILLITFIAVAIARKRGMRNSFIKSTWISFLSLVGLVGLFLVMNDPTSMSGNIGIAIVLFVILYTLAMGFGAIPSTLVNPMIADVSDYETYKSGRYVPGMLGTLFSFVDKLITSLAPAIVGFGVALIGFTAEFPTVSDPLTTPLYGMTLLLGFGLPALMLIVSLVAMKFYNLDDKKMEEIQTELAKMKAEGKVEESELEPETNAI